jgi:Tol biopolymer transport system component
VRLKSDFLATAIWPILAIYAMSCVMITSCKKHLGVDDIMPIPGSRSNDVYPAWSPDGSTIIYCHNHISLVDGVLTPFPESSGLWFISPDGSHKRMFKNRQGFMHMDWSPDGQWFVFGENHQIWKLKVTGDSLTLVLSDSTGRNYHPMWSPDGKRIVFDRFQEDGKTGIYTVAADGTDLRYIGYGCAPDWSPDGRRIAYTGDDIIGIKDTSGANDRRLLTTDASGAGNVAFSPDGSKIAFGATIDKVGGLYVVDTSGRNLRLLAKDACLPSWSPDGTRIVYALLTLERSSSGDVTSDQLLYIMNADGSGKKQLTFGPGPQ